MSNGSWNELRNTRVWASSARAHTSASAEPRVTVVALAAFFARVALVAYAGVRPLVRRDCALRCALRARAVQTARTPAAHEAIDRVLARIIHPSYVAARSPWRQRLSKPKRRRRHMSSRTTRRERCGPSAVQQDSKATATASARPPDAYIKTLLSTSGGGLSLMKAARTFTAWPPWRAVRFSGAVTRQHAMKSHSGCGCFSRD